MLFAYVLNLFGIAKDSLGLIKSLTFNVTALATHQLVLEKKLDAQGQQISQIAASVIAPPDAPNPDQQILDDLTQQFHSKLDRLQAVIENFNQPKEN